MLLMHGLPYKRAALVRSSEDENERNEIKVRSSLAVFSKPCIVSASTIVASDVLALHVPLPWVFHGKEKW